MTEKKEEPKPMTSEEMKFVIEQERQGRIEACGREIQGVLQKYNCSLEAQTVIRNNAVASQALIVAND